MRARKTPWLWCAALFVSLAARGSFPPESRQRRDESRQRRESRTASMDRTSPAGSACGGGACGASTLRAIDVARGAGARARHDAEGGGADRLTAVDDTARGDGGGRACRAVIDGYALRWRVEEFSKARKSSICHAEDARLWSAEAIQKWATSS